MFTPLTAAARAWVDENVPLEPWQWLGESFGVDRRFADDMTQYMQDDGLQIQW